MKILIIGANGFLGLKILNFSEIYAPNDVFYGADIDISLIPEKYTKFILDITNEEQINKIVTEVNVG